MLEDGAEWLLPDVNLLAFCSAVCWCYEVVYGGEAVGINLLPFYLAVFWY